MQRMQRMSTTKITEKDIENLANLARINVGESEKTQLVKEIDSILAYVDTIKKATIVSGNSSNPSDFGENTEGRVGAVKNITRTDSARVLSESDRERIIVEAPDREGDFLAVKKIL